MKKSGNAPWFILFGIVAQALYLACLFLFFNAPANFGAAFMALLVVVFEFICLRALMDWEKSDSVVEDYLRESFIGERFQDRFVIGFIGGTLLFFSNPLQMGFGLKAFVVGILVTSLAQSLMESVRRLFIMLTYSKPSKTQSISGQGVTMA